MKTVYITNDGTQFVSKIEAEKYEKRIVNKEEDLKNAKENLSKALICLKSPSLENHQKSQDMLYSIEKYLRSATVSDENYSSSDNC